MDMFLLMSGHKYKPTVWCHIHVCRMMIARWTNSGWSSVVSAHEYATKENSILDYDSFHQNNYIVCVIIHGVHKAHCLGIIFCIATLTTHLRLWNSNGNKVKSHCHEFSSRLFMAVSGPFTVGFYCEHYHDTMSVNVLLLWNRDLCFPQNCWYACVGNVPCASMCLENGLLSFSGPCVPDIDLWSTAITLSESKHYPASFSKIPNIFPFSWHLPPFPLCSHQLSSPSSHLPLCLCRSGSAASLWLWDEPVICGLTNETWSCRLEREQEVQLGIMCCRCRWALLFGLFLLFVALLIYGHPKHIHTVTVDRPDALLQSVNHMYELLNVSPV